MVILTAAVFITCEGSSAQELEVRSQRIEASVSYEYLRPNDVYGDWNAGNLVYYSTLSPDFTWFLQGSAYNRRGGNGLTGTAGAYKDWRDFLYTYSSITAGSNSDYLPKFRADHDFNFKLGGGKNYVITAGITYIDYFDDHSDLIISGGPTLYLTRWIIQYRLFYNKSNPGSIGSFSHLISAGYGEEGRQWTYLNLSFGKQAYLATSIAEPQAVNQDSFYTALQHRRWLKEYYGIFGDVSYFTLEDGYNKLGISCGFFYEF